MKCYVASSILNFNSDFSNLVERNLNLLNGKESYLFEIESLVRWLIRKESLEKFL